MYPVERTSIRFFSVFIISVQIFYGKSCCVIQTSDWAALDRIMSVMIFGTKEMSTTCLQRRSMQAVLFYSLGQVDQQRVDVACKYQGQFLLIDRERREG